MSVDGVSDYGWRGGEGPTSCGYLTPAVRRLLSRVNVRRVLDVGAGNGALARVLAADGYDVVGIDADQAGVEIARRSAPAVSFYRLGVYDDPHPLLASEGVFDAVVSTEVVEHLYSPQFLPKFAYQCLKPGGVLLVSTPYHGYWKNLALAISGAWDRHLTALWHGGHIKFWSVSTLSRLLEENGFRVVSFTGVGRLPWLWKSMILTAVRDD